jgi:hypothetical protein
MSKTLNPPRKDEHRLLVNVFEAAVEKAKRDGSVKVDVLDDMMRKIVLRSIFIPGVYYIDMILEWNGTCYEINQVISFETVEDLAHPCQYLQASLVPTYEFGFGEHHWQLKTPKGMRVFFEAHKRWSEFFSKTTLW